MPSEQPLAQDLMQEAFNSNGSHVERFLSPTILSVPPDLERVHENTATELNEMAYKQEEKYVSAHLNSHFISTIIFIDQTRVLKIPKWNGLMFC